MKNLILVFALCLHAAVPAHVGAIIVRQATVEQTYNHQKCIAIFSGVLTSVDDYLSDGRPYGKVCTFRVAQVWKGPLRREFEVNMCESYARRFRLDVHYVVYAGLRCDGEHLYAHGTRTAKASVAIVDRYLLGQLRKPFIVDPYLALPPVSDKEYWEFQDPRIIEASPETPAGQD